ncbi:glycosyltransferase [Microbacterium sp. CFH 31415]|uniref:glycosyltransferase n=1 Tax=Microbacterium sp. CFH 31415 TaxID=2921732 RepID=UPI001F1422EC|nr:glycosyltransferase [Microbacterium sp. CFH 31415]MCH6230373.1 glycosyltransferase [Microbacterium sp. CFH 31415]
MHVVMFGDQHVETLGGAQVSMRLQRRFLELAGHTVTIVAPAVHGPRGRSIAADAAYLDLPSIPITFDREYSMSWPGRRTDRWVDAALAARPPVDVVHIQADFWGAFIGHRYAARHGLPVVHTMHNRVDVGVEATAPFPSTVLAVLNAWQRRALDVQSSGDADGSDGWAFLRRFAGRSHAVTAPSTHFARRLEDHGVVPGGRRGILDLHSPGSSVDVVWNGIDDDVLDATLAEAPEGRAPGPARLVWLGRMSPEKRLLPFLEALAESGVRAEVEVIGGGGQLAAAERVVARTRPAASVVFAGRLPYAETLRRIAGADAVVQTSIGFETQGMTIFEAASLGTPSVVSDPDLAAELGAGFWRVGEGTRADASTGALAEALRTAVADIDAGASVPVDPTIRERFRQSSRTAAMVEIYDRIIAG